MPAPGMFCTTTVGIAGNMAAEMTADEPRIDVVAAARPIADDQRHRFSAVEIGDRVGLGRQRQPQQPSSARTPAAFALPIDWAWFLSRVLLRQAYAVQGVTGNGQPTDAVKGAR